MANLTDNRPRVTVLQTITLAELISRHAIETAELKAQVQAAHGRLDSLECAYLDLQRELRAMQEFLLDTLRTLAETRSS